MALKPEMSPALCVFALQGSIQSLPGHTKIPQSGCSLILSRRVRNPGSVPCGRCLAVAGSLPNQKNLFKLRQPPKLPGASSLCWQRSLSSCLHVFIYGLCSIPLCSLKLHSDLSNQSAIFFRPMDLSTITAGRQSSHGRVTSIGRPSPMRHGLIACWPSGVRSPSG
jgi:hypothetical protein